VPIDTIKEFFRMTDLIINNNTLSSVELTLLEGDEWIPSDILGSKKTEELRIQCLFYNHGLTLLKVDVNAFQSTKNYTKTLTLLTFNSSQLYLGFLSGFNQLTNLTFYNVYDFKKSLNFFPFLPKLTVLEFDYVEGLDDHCLILPT